MYKIEMNYIVLLMSLLLGKVGSGHPISTIDGTLGFSEKGITISMNVMVEDFLLFGTIDPSVTGEALAPDILQAATKDHGPYLLENVVVHDGWGRRLTGKVTNIVVPERLKSPLSRTKLMDFKVHYQLHFPFLDKRRPRFLALYQTLGRSTRIPATILLKVARGSQSAAESLSLSNGQQVRIIPLASAPSKSTEDPRVDLDMINPLIQWGDQVKVSLTMPLPLLDKLVPGTVNGRKPLDTKEQGRLRAAVEKLAKTAWRLHLDGLEQTPRTIACSLVPLEKMETGEPLHPITTRAELVVTYELGQKANVETKKPPLAFEWQLFHGRMQRVRLHLQSYDSTRAVDLTSYAPKWTLQK